jgi:hypothetical protein
VKRIEYRVIEDIAQLASVAALCGGSDNVRYGRAWPEKLFVAELDLRPGDKIWIFVHFPGDGRLTAQVEWHEGLWTLMASNGIQPADCPIDVWAGPPRWFRQENIPSEPLTFEQALAQHIEANPGSVHTADFTAWG